MVGRLGPGLIIVGDQGHPLLQTLSPGELAAELCINKQPGAQCVFGVGSVIQSYFLFYLSGSQRSVVVLRITLFLC